MGFEIRYHYHPKKEEGAGYDTEKKEVLTKKVGKNFDDTPLEKLAGAIMSQMARRDILIFDVEVDEFVRKNVSFKETKDGRGIILKNKRFSFNATADMVASDVQEDYYEEEGELQPHEIALQPRPQQPLPAGLQPHEMMDQRNVTDDLYANPNRPVPVKRQPISQKYNINPNKVIYWAYFEPEFYASQARGMGLKFTENKKYPVHHVVQINNKLDMQRLVVTDDTGRQVEVEDKFFTPAGAGLTGGFESDSRRSEGRQPKLMYQDELVIDPSRVKYAEAGAMVAQDQGNFPTDIDIRSGRGGQQMPQGIPQGIPVDDGTVPADLLEIPDIRPGKKTV